MTGAAAAAGAAPAVTIVQLGELCVTADRRALLRTFALGSCLGVAVHDPVAGVGGLLHAMMPDSSIDLPKAQAQPGMFIDTGIPALFRACYALGARKDRLVVRLAGGASIHSAGDDPFRIGRRNLLMARQQPLAGAHLEHTGRGTGEHDRGDRVHGASALLLIRRCIRQQEDDLLERVDRRVPQAGVQRAHRGVASISEITVRICSGANGFFTNTAPRLSIRAMRSSDRSLETTITCR